VRKAFVMIGAVVASSCATETAAVRVVEGHNLSPEQAQAVVSEFQSKRPSTVGSDPLSSATTTEQALEILRRDQLELFPKGLEIAGKDQSVQGRALAAQLELAWGEAQHILSDLLDRATSELRDERQSLTRRAAAKPLSEKETARLDVLNKTLEEVAGMSDALTTLGNDHLKKGITAAEAVIAANPNDYVGYRVAADCYRIEEDWPKFDEAMKKLTELKPDSNGLIFARAMEALERNHDRKKALDLLAEALVKDPKFTRARTQRLLAHDSVEDAWREYQELKQESPNHQVVVWLGPALEREYESYEAEQRASERTQHSLQLLNKHDR
jgi:hypothetical protein